MELFFVYEEHRDDLYYGCEHDKHLGIYTRDKAEEKAKLLVQQYKKQGFKCERLIGRDAIRCDYDNGEYEETIIIYFKRFILNEGV